MQDKQKTGMPLVDQKCKHVLVVKAAFEDHELSLCEEFHKFCDRARRRSKTDYLNI